MKFQEIRNCHNKQPQSEKRNPLGGAMQLIQRAVSPIWSALFFLVALLSFGCPRLALALEEVIVSYAGPTVTFLPAEVARQRGFLREQNLDIKLLLTRSEVDRAALVSGSVDYTLRAGSSFVSAARGLPGAGRFSRHDETFLGLGGSPANEIRE
jgi:ABC-type nitrate/sulfonate/bicarbonate transport system substrate-binding protein